MNCSKCGAEVVADAVFCQKCGARLHAGAPGGESVSARGRTISDTPEETLWEGRYSPKAMVGTWIAGGIANFVLIVASIYLLATHRSYWWTLLAVSVLLDIYVIVRYAIRRFGTRYRLTNHRFFHEAGIISRMVNPIDLITINDVAFVQGPIERIMNVGRVKIMSADTSDPILWVEGIEDVQRIATLIDKTRREETMRRRVFYDATPHG